MIENARADCENDVSMKKATRPLCVVMCGPSLNQSNSGDRLLAGTLTRILKDDVGVERVTYSSVSVDPRVFHDVPHIEVVSPRRHPWKLLWRALRADVLIVGGAVAFHNHARVMLKQALLAKLCQLGGGRVVINAVSVQPLRSRICRWLFRSTCATASWFTVRDDVSSKNARLAGATNLPRRSSDPGIISPSSCPERTNQILTNEGIPVDRPLFAIVPHFFANGARYFDARYTTFDIEYQHFSDHTLDRYYDAMAQVADSLVNLGTVIFVPMCTKTPPGDDREAADWIKQRMRHPSRVISVQGEYKINELAGILSRCQLQIASRLHGYALGLAEGIPSLAIDFHPKVRGLAKDVGLSDWIFDIVNLDAGRLREAVSGILRDHARAKERVREGVNTARRRAWSDFITGVRGSHVPRAA